MSRAPKKPNPNRPRSTCSGIVCLIALTHASDTSRGGERRASRRDHPAPAESPRSSFFSFSFFFSFRFRPLVCFVLFGFLLLFFFFHFPERVPRLRPGPSGARRDADRRGQHARREERRRRRPRPEEVELDEIGGAGAILALRWERADHTEAIYHEASRSGIGPQNTEINSSRNAPATRSRCGPVYTPSHRRRRISTGAPKSPVRANRRRRHRSPPRSLLPRRTRDFEHRPQGLRTGARPSA